jgi:hypothetical protein
VQQFQQPAPVQQFQQPAPVQQFGQSGGKNKLYKKKYRLIQ